MAIYAYRCDACEHDFDVRKPMSEATTDEACPLCEGETRKLITGCGVIFKGDGWVSKNGRIASQMRAKNRRLTAKQEEMRRDAPTGGTLVPNVDGELVDSWGEARKLASSQGKDTSGYDQRVRRDAELKKKPSLS